VAATIAGENGAPPERRFGWQGVVRDPSGAPLAGVALADDSETLSMEGESPYRETRSDARGRFFLPWPPNQPWDPGDDIFLLAWKTGFLLPEFPLPPPADPPTPLTLQFEPALGKAEFLVLDWETGRPVERAPIQLVGDDWRVRGLTGPQGRLALVGRAGDRCQVDTWPGGVSGSLFRGERFPLEAGKIRKKTLRFIPAPGAVHLVAREAGSGIPLPGAVFLRFGLIREETWDGDGFASTTGTPLSSTAGELLWTRREGDPDPEFSCEVSAPGHIPVRVVLFRRPEEDPLVVELPVAKPVTLDWRLLQGGVPLAGARIQILLRSPALRLDNQFQPIHWEAESDQGCRNGAGGVTGEDGGVRLTVATPMGRLPESIGITVKPAGERPRDFGRLETRRLGSMPWILDLQPPTGHVEFVARDAGGKPVSGIAVSTRLEVSGSSPLLLRAQPSHHRTGWTAENGVWAADFPAPAVLFWRVAHTDSSTSEHREPLVPGKSTRIEVLEDSRDSTIQGRVVDASEAPWKGWAGLKLLLRRMDGSPQAKTSVSGTNGGFSFRDVPPGRYRLEGSPFPLAEGPPLIVEPGARNVVVRLAPLCILRTRLLDADSGQPLSAGVETWIHSSFGIFSFHEMAEGWIVARFPPGGNLELKGSARGHVPRVLPIGAWKGGETRDRIVRLERGRTLRLHLRPDRRAVQVTWIRRKERTGESAFPDDLPMNEMGFQFRILPGLPRTALVLVALDEAGNPVGRELAVPAGDEDLELVWDLEE